MELREALRSVSAIGAVGGRLRVVGIALSRGAPSWRYRADWIPAYAGMTVLVEVLALRAGRGAPIGSRFRGNDVAPGWTWGRGAWRPVMALSRRLDSRLRGNDGNRATPDLAPQRALIGEAREEGERLGVR